MPKYLALSNSSKYIVQNGRVREFYIDTPGLSKGHKKQHVRKPKKKRHTIVGKLIHSKAFEIVGGIVAAAAVTVGSTLLLNPELGVAADAAILGAETGGEAVAATAGTAAVEAATTAAATEGAATAAAEVAATTATAAETSAATTAAEAAGGGGLLSKAKKFLKGHKDQIDQAKSAVQNIQQQQQQQVPQQQINNAINQNDQIATYLSQLEQQYNSVMNSLPDDNSRNQYSQQFQNWFSQNVLSIPQINNYLQSNS